MFISPKYNVGEKVAGGTLTVYTDHTMQEKAQLWAYADLRMDGAEGGMLANPVPVDNNGINSSPVFYDEESYPDAYYVLRDARGAIVREGHITPYSWQGGGKPDNPPGGGPWANALGGDWYWGYEVVQAGNLASRDIVDRPLYVVPNLAGDRAGDWNFQKGLVVARASGSSQDGVLTFASNTAGIVWKARSEYINSSYLIARGKDAGWLESNYKGEYSINLDQCFEGNNITAYFSGKVRLAKNISAPSQGSYGLLLNSENLEILVPNAINRRSISTFYIYVPGGSFRASSIADSDGNQFVNGNFDTLIYDQENVKIMNTSIGYLKGSRQNLQASGKNWDDITIADRVDFSVLKNVPLKDWLRFRALILNEQYMAADLNGSDGINFDILQQPFYQGNLLRLTDSANSGNSYSIKPSPFLSYDSTFYAKNAEFYSVAKPAASIASTNRHIIGSQCAGTLTLGSFNSNLLDVDSGNVDIESRDRSLSAWVRKAGRIRNATVKFDLSEGNDKDFSAREIADSDIYAGYWQFNGNSIGDGTLRAKLRGCVIENCAVNLGCQRLSLLGSKMHGSQVAGMPRFAGGTYDPSYYWNSVLDLGDDSEAAGSSFSDCMVSLWPEDSKHLRNIKFLNCMAASDNTYLDLLSSSFIASAITEYPLIAEGVEIAGNHADDQDHAFKVLCNSYTGNVPFIEGHIEIDGYYDYASTSGTPIAGRTFPMNGKNVTLDKYDGAKGICLYVYGDPLKYSTDDGTFVLANPNINDDYANDRARLMTNRVISGQDGLYILTELCNSTDDIFLYRIRE